LAKDGNVAVGAGSIANVYVVGDVADECTIKDVATARQMSPRRD
jgi:hypothetical protein